jgi:hypothetical protein
MNLAVGTVRKYAYAESFPVPEVPTLRPSILDPYLARLVHVQASYCAWRMGIPSGQDASAYLCP